MYGPQEKLKEINENSNRLYRSQHMLEYIGLSLSLREYAASDAESFVITLLIVKLLIKMFTSINLALSLHCANPGANARLCDNHWLALMV